MPDAATILAVEDDEDVRALVREILARAGFRVVEAESGEAALRILASGESVDLLFTDIVMPGLNGLDLARQAQRLRPGLAVLFASAYWSHIALAPPAKDFVRKPYRPDHLVARVRRSLEGAGLGEVPG